MTARDVCVGVVIFLGTLYVIVGLVHLLFLGDYSFVTDLFLIGGGALVIYAAQHRGWR